MSSQPQTITDTQLVPTPDLQVSEVEILAPEIDLPSHRDENGRFIKGNCANPLGRPSTRSISEKLREYLAKGYDDKIARRMVTIAVKSRNEANAIKASEFVADRTEGKPVQAIAVQHGIDDRTADRLADIAEKMGLMIGTQTDVSGTE